MAKYSLAREWGVREEQNTKHQLWYADLISYIWNRALRTFFSGAHSRQHRPAMSMRAMLLLEQYFRGVSAKLDMENDIELVDSGQYVVCVDANNLVPLGGVNFDESTALDLHIRIVSRQLQNRRCQVVIFYMKTYADRQKQLAALKERLSDSLHCTHIYSVVIDDALVHMDSVAASSQKARESRRVQIADLERLMHERRKLLDRVKDAKSRFIQKYVGRTSRGWKHKRSVFVYEDMDPSAEDVPLTNAHSLDDLWCANYARRCQQQGTHCIVMTGDVMLRNIPAVLSGSELTEDNVMQALRSVGDPMVLVKGELKIVETDAPKKLDITDRTREELDITDPTRKELDINNITDDVVSLVRQAATTHEAPDSNREQKRRKQTKQSKKRRKGERKKQEKGERKKEEKVERADDYLLRELDELAELAHSVPSGHLCTRLQTLQNDIHNTVDTDHENREITYSKWLDDVDSIMEAEAAFQYIQAERVRTDDLLNRVLAQLANVQRYAADDDPFDRYEMTISRHTFQRNMSSRVLSLLLSDDLRPANVLVLQHIPPGLRYNFEDVPAFDLSSDLQKITDEYVAASIRHRDWLTRGKVSNHAYGWNLSEQHWEWLVDFDAENAFYFNDIDELVESTARESLVSQWKITRPSFETGKVVLTCQERSYHIPLDSMTVDAPKSKAIDWPNQATVCHVKLHSQYVYHIDWGSPLGGAYFHNCRVGISMKYQFMFIPSEASNNEVFPVSSTSLYFTEHVHKLRPLKVEPLKEEGQLASIASPNSQSSRKGDEYVNAIPLEWKEKVEENQRKYDESVSEYRNKLKKAWEKGEDEAGLNIPDEPPKWYYIPLTNEIVQVMKYSQEDIGNFCTPAMWDVSSSQEMGQSDRLRNLILFAAQRIDPTNRKCAFVMAVRRLLVYALAHPTHHTHFEKIDRDAKNTDHSIKDAARLLVATFSHPELMDSEKWTKWLRTLLVDLALLYVREGRNLLRESILAVTKALKQAKLADTHTASKVRFEYYNRCINNRVRQIESLWRGGPYG